MRDNGILKIGYLFLMMAMMIPATSALAVPYNFYGEAEGGIASATIDFAWVGHVLTLTIDNTSSVDLMGGTTGGNSPGITGIGFNIDPELSLISWEMSAYTVGGVFTTIGSSDPGIYEWIMGTSGVGVEFDYLPNTFGSVSGALYNPAAAGDPNNTLPGGSNANFFTTAVLELDFSGSGQITDTWLRMQNVGAEGEGSTKSPGAPVPEPATMLLLGTGLLGTAIVSRRKLLKSKRFK